MFDDEDTCEHGVPLSEWCEACAAIVAEAGEGDLSDPTDDGE
jgi:hypothetical protein